MSSGILFAIIVCCSLVAIIFITSVFEWLEAQSKGRPVSSKELDERLDRIETTLADLRDTARTSLDHSLSVERNLETIEHRLNTLERRSDTQSAGRS